MKLNNGNLILPKLPRWISLSTRILLGLIMIVFGLNAFLAFIPVPEFHPFMQLLVDSEYIYFIKTIEIIGGCCLLFPRTTNLGLLLITPIIVNICAYHFFFDQRNWVVSAVIAILNLLILYNQSEDFWKLVTAPNHRS